MPKTNFVDGTTAVVAEWLNKVFTHVHDGADEDGSAPKIDLQDHIDYGPGGFLQHAVGTDYHRINHTLEGGGPYTGTQFSTDRLIARDYVEAPQGTIDSLEASWLVAGAADYTLRLLNPASAGLSPLRAYNTAAAWGIVRIGWENTAPRPLTLLRSYNIAGVSWEGASSPTIIRVDFGADVVEPGIRRHVVAVVTPYYGGPGEPGGNVNGPLQVEMRSVKEDRFDVRIVEQVLTGTDPGPFTSELYFRGRDDTDPGFRGCDIHFLVL